MAVNTTNTFDNTFVGVMFELSNTLVAAVSDVLSGAATVGNSVFTTLNIWHSRQVQRKHLLDLDDRQLDDIGLNRGQALIEAGKSFWQN